MSFICQFRRQAEADLEDIAMYIAKGNSKRALSFVAGLRAHCLRVAENPRVYALRQEYGLGIRLTVHGSYLIFHSTSEDSLIIERIVHSARHREGLMPNQD